MKIRLFSAALCLLLALSGLGWAHLHLAQDLQKVSFREQPYMGDPAAAEGLRAELHLEQRDQLFWETTLPLDNEPATRFHFSPKVSTQTASNKELFSLMVAPALNCGWSSTGSPLDFDDDPIFLAFRDSFLSLAKQTKYGATRSETVPLNAILSHYPLHTRMNFPRGLLPDIPAKDLHQEERDFLQELSDLFPLPVLDDHMVTLEVTLNPAGDLVKAQVQDSENSPIDRCNTLSVLTDQDLFFTLEVRDKAGQLLDYRDTALGYGIYRLPYTECSLSADGLESFFPLEPEQHPIALSANEDESRLFLYSSWGEKGVLQIFDLESGTELQRLTLERNDPASLLIGEGCVLLAFHGDNSFSLFALEDGGVYQKAFDGQLPPIQEFSLGLNWESAIAYDGERLALMGLEPWVEGQRVGYCSPNLAIYNRDGLLYAGIYRCSLDESTAAPSVEQDQWDHSQFCRLSPPQALHLHWNESSPKD